MRKLLWSLATLVAFVAHQAEADTNLIYTCNVPSAEGLRADTFTACPSWTWNRPNTGLIASCGAASCSWTAAVTWRRPENVQGTWATSVCRSNITVGAKVCAAEAWASKASVFPAGPPPVHCVVSAWSDWAPLTDWGACVNDVQSRTEQRTRTVVTPPANGGLPCPVLSETRVETRSCAVQPTPPSVPYKVTAIVNYDACTFSGLVTGDNPTGVEAQKLGSTAIIQSIPPAIASVTCEQLGVAAGQAIWVRIRGVNAAGPGPWSGYWPVVRFEPAAVPGESVTIEYSINKNNADSFTTQCPSP